MTGRYIAVVGGKATLGECRTALRCDRRDEAEEWAKARRHEGEFAAVVLLGADGKQAKSWPVAAD